jgi:hypothetical protein
MYLGVPLGVFFMVLNICSFSFSIEGFALVDSNLYLVITYSALDVSDGYHIFRSSPLPVPYR